ncbi:hypothetical protein Tco_0422484, partial [Tanacetum coccineum]
PSLPLKSPVYHEPSVASVVSASVVDRSIGIDNPHLSLGSQADLWCIEHLRTSFCDETKGKVFTQDGAWAILRNYPKWDAGELFAPDDDIGSTELFRDDPRPRPPDKSCLHFDIVFSACRTYFNPKTKAIKTWELEVDDIIEIFCQKDAPRIEESGFDIHLAYLLFEWEPFANMRAFKDVYYAASMSSLFRESHYATNCAEVNITITTEVISDSDESSLLLVLKQYSIGPTYSRLASEMFFFSSTRWRYTGHVLSHSCPTSTTFGDAIGVLCVGDILLRVVEGTSFTARCAMEVLGLASFFDQRFFLQIYAWHVVHSGFFHFAGAYWLVCTIAGNSVVEIEELEK